MKPLIIGLGNGEFSVSASTRMPNATPALTVRRLVKPQTVGDAVTAITGPATDFLLIMEIPDRAAARVLLRVAQHIEGLFDDSDPNA